MTNIVRIRRRTSGAPGAPSSLQNAELAFNEVGDVLYYGLGTGGAGGSASAVIPIGGSGAFVDLFGDQTIDGNKTFSETIIGSISGNAGTVTNGVYTTDTGTVTNTMLAGGITNAKLANSSVTIGSTSVALGATVTTLAGLTSVSAADFIGDLTGNADTATKLATSRNFSISGDASAPSVGFDGSGNVALTLTLADVNSNVGTYTKLTVNAKGQVTGAADASISDLTVPTADVSFDGFRIVNVADPVNPQDGATKGYVDSVAQGLDIKASVKAATAGNITLSGEQNIDGISVSAGDRVLVKSQTNPAQNGIYIVSASAWSRAPDANTWAQLVSAFTFVEEGNTEADTGWVCTVNAGGTLGTDPVQFAQFSGAGSYQAGDGLYLNGGVFSVVANGGSIDVSGAGIKISDTYAGQASITTVGTISTGTWQGTAVGVAYGGLGLTSALTGLVKGDGSSYAAATAGVDYLDPNSTIDGGTF